MCVQELSNSECMCGYVFVCVQELSNPECMCGYVFVCVHVSTCV